MPTATLSKTAPDTSAPDELKAEASQPDVTDAGQLLTIDQVAHQLQVKAITVRRLIWQKKLDAYKVGSLYRIRPAAVQEYLDGETNDGKAPKWPYCSA
jgi:excisionase family DNA binding protein